MSFSSNLKDELCHVFNSSRHCNIAELAGIISFLARVKISIDNEFTLSISTDNAGLARKCFTILKKTFNISTGVRVVKSSFLSKKHVYTIYIKDNLQAKKILMTTKLLNKYFEVEENLELEKNMILSKKCCRRAFLRAAFLCAGSISDPEKAYHFEIACSCYEKAMQILNLFVSFSIDAKIIERKNLYVIYVKDSEQIATILALMEANKSLLELENIRILKGMRNNINRKINCEMANINKTIVASLKQIEDIKYIEDNYTMDILSENLKEVAILRLKYPEASLSELGSYLFPTVSKSGINHRLRKISMIVDKLKDERGI